VSEIEKISITFEPVVRPAEFGEVRDVTLLEREDLAARIARNVEIDRIDAVGR